MKRINITYLTLLASLLLSPSLFAQNKGGYEIKIRVKGYKGEMLYLANYFADKTYKADSALLDQNGWAIFKGKNPLPCGVYMTALGYTKLFEFAVNEQFFTLETDTADLVANMKVKGSAENDMFLKYQLVSGELGSKIYKFRNLMLAAEKDSTKKKEAAVWRDSMSLNGRKEANYVKEMVAKNPGKMFTQMLQTMEELQIPATPLNPDGSMVDSNFKYHYFIAHYWDKMDFTRDCMLRSPVFHNKLKKYFDQILQDPDSIIYEADRIIAKSKGTPELYKYIVQYITNTYANSSFICMDAVPVHMILKYYTFKDCWWVDSTEIIRSRTRAEAMLPTLCHQIAPNIAMHDSLLAKEIIRIVKTDTIIESRNAKILAQMAKFGTTDLHKVKAEYTVIIFWDPDCSHCKAEMPFLKEIYEKYHKYGVEFYGVGVEQEYDKWVNYVRANDLKWINVIDVYNISEFRKYYDISSTPVIILLDKNKKILAKKLAHDGLELYLKHELKISDKKEK